MATILLSAAGAAIGSSFGGSVLGLSMTAVGRFAGAALGRRLNQSLLGQGSDAVETGRIDRFRLTGAGEGAPIAQVLGRMRVGGHVIWASEFTEHARKRGGTGGGKGAPAGPRVRECSYSVSLALALCEGEITSVGRVWADGAEIAPGDLNMRVYPGTVDQLPDPKIEAVEGVGQVPAYRGTAYVVLEDLDLGRFGNRVPQFSFEVTRSDLSDESAVPKKIRAVAMIPGTGEYALAASPVHMHYADASAPFSDMGARRAVVNVNNPGGKPDFNVALEQLRAEMPECGAVSLIVSWFGDDLRCGSCSIRPKVVQTAHDAASMPWRVGGLTRAAASTVPVLDGSPVYGGTPADQSVVQAIGRMRDQGLAVMYYPFILMDQLETNARTDPWSGNADQPALPWRGRITTSIAPGRAGTPDGTIDAAAEVSAFFGAATAKDFGVENGEVTYSGPDEWGYSRFVLHQAALCAAAGGVDSFCIGSEMRGLTQIRGASGFPAVDALRTLAAECRKLLGPEVKIGYAADWTEYFGYHLQDGSGDVYFHLDPLWGDGNIDFVGIDNYMPLSDWRDGDDHADAEWGSIYNLAYLKSNIEGGEGYDWYYSGPESRAAQRRIPIEDGAHDEPWIWRYKDLRGWWDNHHHERIGGIRQSEPTAWIPRSKPFWFTEFGCAAIDKGANQPNKFLDAKSSESDLPHHSNGLRDELIQHQYLAATLEYWSDPDNNPVSDLYGGSMLDIERAFVWAWDARPYPWFPSSETLWTDGPNYCRGHWLNGRASGRTLASVVTEICARAGLMRIDTTALHGFIRGYVIPDLADARQALQPLMLAYGFDAIERDGALVFRMRSGAGAIDLSPDEMADLDEIDGAILESREGEAEMTGRVRLKFVLADADHQVAAEEAILPDERTHAVSQSELPLALTRAEGRQTVERWLSEARIARDTMRFALPPSQLAIGAGDVIRVQATSGPVLARVDRVEVTDRQIIDAVRIEPDVFRPSDFPEDSAPLRPFTPAVPVSPVFLDLPLMTGDELPHAPHIAVTATPWPGSVALYDAAQDEGYALNGIVPAQSVIGVTETALLAARSGLIDRGAPLEVRLFSGALQSISDTQLLAGGNLLAIGDGSPGNWELLQFRDASLLAQDRWSLSHRLRGQAGSDGLMPEVWPAGSLVVVLNGAPRQIALSSAQRRVQRHFRIGPAQRGYDDPSFTHLRGTFDGNGLRPYRPAHLRARADGADLLVSWVRRTRVDGDGWDGYDVPLGEEREAYLVRVMRGGSVLREVATAAPHWTYRASDRARDGEGGSVEIAVAQISDRYGPGPFARLAA
ncbi:baseplate multidomain protein megatron [Citreimonas salinaria]|uniref:Putative phage tail protein n=1 Tax=Citreimonas salinaria TaxID=321339 RepID=A0A1H3H0J1_9RHOB|nr:glycoside hydrolase/phage tail family protein [Citreimonas salinaria]SDY08264.1 Putative phage tail protein [Citreimonas salinaria]